MQLLFFAAMLAADDTLAATAPSLYSPTATSYSVALKWKDPSTSERSWAVERSTTSGGNFVVIATLSSNSTRYVDSRVMPNQTYYYRVVYLTAGGSRKYSDTEKIRTKSDTTPPVVNLTSPGSNSLVTGEINLAATVTDQGGVALVNFYLDTALIGSSTNPPYYQNLNTKQMGDGTHSVRVVAFDMLGNQAGSPNVTFTTDNTPPSVPSPTAEAASFSQINLTWPASIDAGAAGLSHYNIYLNGSFVDTSSSLGFSQAGLLPETQYCFMVEAVDALGNTSDASAPVCVTTPAPLVPDTNAPTTPTGLVATSTNCHLVKISWDAASDAGTGVHHYSVRKNGAAWRLVSAPATFVLDPEVAGGTTYSYSVNAADFVDNESSYCSRVIVTTPVCPDTTAPSTPMGLASLLTDCHTVGLSWIASADEGGAGLKGYNLYRNGSFLKQILAPATTVADETLVETNTYSFAISAVDFSGNESLFSTTVPFTTPMCPDLTAPSLVTNLVAVPSGCTTVVVSWNTSTDTGGSGLLGYKLYRDGLLLKTVAAPTTNITDTSVPASTTCTYAVVSLDNAGNSSLPSPAIAATTPACPDTAPPTVPGSVTATATSCGRIELAWAASSDAASGLKNYRIYRNGQLIQTLPPSVVTYSDTAVSATTSYTYAVAAYDNSDNSAISAGVSVAVPACLDSNPPTVPGGVTAIATNCGRVEITWTTASDTGSGLRDYRIYRNGQSIQTVSAAANAYSDTAVSATTSYTYAVVAYDNANNFATSAGVSVTTPACPVIIQPPDLQGRFVAVTNIGTTDAEYAMSVAMDKNGNSFIGGSAAGAPFLCKLSPTKEAIWSLGLANAGSIQSVAVDAQGDVIFTGYFYATVNFGGGAVSSVGGFDIFVVKYSSEGRFVWAKRFGSSNAAEWAGEEAGLGIAVDSKGNIGVSGGYFGGADFGTQILGRVGVKEGFLLMLNPQGTLLWVNTISNSTPASVAFDPQDNLLVGGNFSGSVNMGGSTLTSAGSFDIFLAKFTPTGRHLWSKRTGGFSYDTINALTVDSAGDVVATGTYRLQANFDGLVYAGLGSEDVFVGKFDGATGAQRWIKTFGSEYSEYGYGVATDAARNITVVGRFGGPIDFGGGLVTGAPGNNVFVVKLSPGGSHIWSKAIGSGREDARGVVTDARNHIHIAGRFSFTVDFGGGRVTSTGGTVYPDIFLLELEP